MPHENQKPVVLVTGVGGSVGTALARALGDRYHVVGLDLSCKRANVECIQVDLTDDDAIAQCLRKVRERHGSRIASVVHLAAYFDFTGEEHPLYRKLNVEGTRKFLRGLRQGGLEVEQFVYAGTMLGHEAGVPGERLTEDQPIKPGWAYPISKAEAERVIAEEAGDIPYVLLHLAGLYDERTAVPTLSHQIARIYERDIKSHVYAGDPSAGQSFIHRDDMADAFRKAIDRRDSLPRDITILVGEPEGVGYERLQDAIGREIHGEEDWTTITVPRPIAKAAAWAELHAEPLIPDLIDRGEEPFIRPFMIDLAADHYALDISRARQLLDWEPRHHILRDLPALIAALKRDPLGWYRANKIPPPDWLEAAAAASGDPDTLRGRHESAYKEAHFRGLWGGFLVAGLGTWLLITPALVPGMEADEAWNDAIMGLLLMGFGLVALDWRRSWARWAAAAVGFWLLFAPLFFWTNSAAVYMNDTLVGMLAIGFAVLIPPAPGVAPAAAWTGPDRPPGWDFNPSAWLQRLPIIILAFVGLHISRMLAAYQLGHVDSVWEPFFEGSTGPKNGTEEIITSSVSAAWPVPDGGLGAMIYALEILTGVIGSTRRWRTMPWLVVLFGIMIVPLGIVSITFIIIQPIVIGTWCTLCLIAAAAMLLQIPYSLDELVATGQFLHRRVKAGRRLLPVLLHGDTDDGEPDGRGARAEFERPLKVVLGDMVGGGVNPIWNLSAAALVGVWLMFSRVTVGAEGGVADADHLVGALAITFSVIAWAEIARPVRFVTAALGAALVIVPFVTGATTAQVLNDVVCGLLLIGLSLRRGPIQRDYGAWNRWLI